LHRIPEKEMNKKRLIDKIKLYLLLHNIPINDNISRKDLCHTCQRYINNKCNANMKTTEIIIQIENNKITNATLLKNRWPKESRAGVEWHCVEFINSPK